MGLTTAWVASGAAWPDALVAGPAAARDGVLVLTDPNGLDRAAPTAAWLRAHSADLARIRLVGGPASLSATVEEDLRALAGSVTPPAPVPTPTPTAAPAPAPSPAPEPTTAPNPGTHPRNAEPHDPGPPAPRIPADAQPWSDPGTWGGRVPAAGEDVTIPEGTAVVLDESTPPLGHLVVEGELHFDPDAGGDEPLTLHARSIVVRGLLSAGAADQPYSGRAEIVLDGVPGDDVEGSGAGVLAVVGGQLDLHGPRPSHTWTRLTATARAAATAITVADTVDWAPGDRIVVAATDLSGDNVEEATIAAIDGTTVRLTAPLKHTHWGAVEVHDGQPVAQQAEVGLLSHDVVVRGADDARETGFGGHVMVHVGAVARMSGIELRDVGQRGVLGRYPVHFHLMGSAPASYLRDSSVHHSANRCVAVHGTLDTLVSGVVAHDAPGHCFFVEDAVETGNRFFCNLGLTTRAPADEDRLLDSDATPATFWLSNASNDLVGNAAAGGDGSGFWYDLPERPTGKFEGSSLEPRQGPFGVFDGNSAHSYRSTGWKTGNGLFVDEYEGPDATLTDFTAWKNGGFGVWLEQGTLTGAVLAENGTSFLGRRASLRDALVVGQTANAQERPWSQIGVALYSDRSSIQDVTLASFRPVEERGPVRALGWHARSTMRRSSTTGLRFVDAQGPQGGTIEETGIPEGVFFADLDGSVAGRPAVVSGEHPLLLDPSCTPFGDGLRACAPDTRNGLLMLKDGSEGDRIDSGSLTRDDGASVPLAPSHGSGVESAVRLDRAYRTAIDGESPTEVNLVLSGEQPGWVDIAIPWTADQAFVARPWQLDKPLPSASSPAALSEATPVFLDTAADLLHVRITVDDERTWSELDLCHTLGCR